MHGNKWQRNQCDARNTLVLSDASVSDMPSVGAVFRQRIVKHINFGCDKTRQQILRRLITGISQLLIVEMYVAFALLRVLKILIMIISRLNIRLNRSDILTVCMYVCTCVLTYVRMYVCM